MMLTYRWVCFRVYGEFITEKSVFGQRSFEIIRYSSGNFSSNNFTNVSTSITVPSIRRKWDKHIYTRTLCYFYGYGTWPFILRKKHRLRVFENRVMRNIHVFGPKREDEAGSGGRLLNKNLYSSPNFIRWRNWELWDWWNRQHVWGQGRGACRALVGHCKERVNWENNSEFFLWALPTLVFM